MKNMCENDNTSLKRSVKNFAQKPQQDHQLYPIYKTH